MSSMVRHELLYIVFLSLLSFFSPLFYFHLFVKLTLQSIFLPSSRSCIPSYSNHTQQWQGKIQRCHWPNVFRVSSRLLPTTKYESKSFVLSMPHRIYARCHHRRQPAWVVELVRCPPRRWQWSWRDHLRRTRRSREDQRYCRRWHRQLLLSAWCHRPGGIGRLHRWGRSRRTWTTWCTWVVGRGRCGMWNYRIFKLEIFIYLTSSG